MIGLVVVLGVIASVLFCIFLCNMFKIQELNCSISSLKINLECSNFSLKYAKSSAELAQRRYNELNEKYNALNERFESVVKVMDDIHTMTAEKVCGVVEVPDTKNGTDRSES